MTSAILTAGALGLVAAALLVAAPRLRRRRLAARSARRILFPFIGSTLSRSTLDGTLRLARADSATLIAAYIASVPMNLSLEAPIPRECETAIPLLELIEQNANRLDVPVEPRIERARGPRHGLTQLIEHERFDRIVVPAQTSRSEGFAPDDIAWLLENAPGEVLVLRPDFGSVHHAPVA